MKQIGDVSRFYICCIISIIIIKINENKSTNACGTNELKLSVKKNSYAIKIKVDMHGWQTFFSLSLKVYFIITYFVI